MPPIETQDTETTKLEKSLIKAHHDGDEIISELRALSAEQKDARLLALAVERQEIITAKAADDELNKVRAEKSNLEAPYRDRTKMNNLISRYISLLMKE